MLKLLYRLQKYDTRTISLGGRSYRAIIADTPTKRAIGLMFRASLPKGSCMLFTFASAGYHSVWMHNMRFPIDVAWLDGKGVVVDTRAGLKPCTSMLNCPQHSPKSPASYMIELNAGEMKRKNIKTGTAARI
jgi:uncharacterized membrane protein (UPF0127 family)